MNKRAYTLCRLFGIDVKMHISFLLLPLLFGWAYGARGLFVVGFVFTCVTLHELSHALQARRFGLRVQDILLYPIGGVANLRSFGHRPAQELATALAGPLFNFVSAGLLFLPVLHWLGAATLLHQDVMWQMSLDTWPKTFASCFWINPLLGLFNLVPAFPMDGGRILRSALARRLTYRRATHIAVRLGQWCAVGFAAWGLFSSPPNLLLVVIAVFVYTAASQERSAVEVRATLEPVPASEVCSRSYVALTAEATAGQALDALLHTAQTDVAVVDGERLVGLLPRAAVIAAARRRGPASPVRALVRRDAPRLEAEESLLRAYQLMEETTWRTVPVVEDERLVGLITLDGISRVYAALSESRA